MASREVYSILKQPIKLQIKLTPPTPGDNGSIAITHLVEASNAVLTIADGGNCYVDSDLKQFYIRPPPTTDKYTTVRFDKIMITTSRELMYKEDDGPPPVISSQFRKISRREWDGVVWLKSNNARNSSKVLISTSNDDYKSDHYMKLPTTFTPTEPIPLYITDSVNGFKPISIDELAKQIAEDFSFDLINSDPLVNESIHYLNVDILDILVITKWYA
jgi:hypothetical protein